MSHGGVDPPGIPQSGWCIQACSSCLRLYQTAMGKPCVLPGPDLYSFLDREVTSVSGQGFSVPTTALGLIIQLYVWCFD